MNICLVSLSTTNISELASWSGRNHITAALDSGFSYYHHQGVIDTSRHPSWSKLHAISRILPWYDGVLWIDADAIVVGIERLLPLTIAMLQDSEVSMFDQPKDGKLNAGIGAFRNSERTLKTIGQAYFADPMAWHAPWWEQEAFQKIKWEDNATKLTQHPHQGRVAYELSAITGTEVFFHAYGPGHEKLQTLQQAKLRFQK